MFKSYETEPSTINWMVKYEAVKWADLREAEPVTKPARLDPTPPVSREDYLRIRQTAGLQTVSLRPSFLNPQLPIDECYDNIRQQANLPPRGRGRMSYGVYFTDQWNNRIGSLDTLIDQSIEALVR